MHKKDERRGSQGNRQQYKGVYAFCGLEDPATLIGGLIEKTRTLLMSIEDFRNSEWMNAAHGPEGEAKVRTEFSSWVHQVKNSGLVDRAYRLWRHLNSPECSTAEKILIIAALLYLISPLDAIPDFIPIAGWLDDVGVATAVLAFLNGKAAES